MRSPAPATRAELEESLGTVLKRAFRDPSYILIFIGFFSCGYQLAFITAHFPAFVTEMCGADRARLARLRSLGITTTSALGAAAISLIGLANIVGTITAGWLGKKYSKKYLLAGIYVARTVVAALFIMLPMTPTTVLLFSLFMGCAVACHGAADFGPCRAYFRAALYGHALRVCLPQPPVGQFSWASGWVARCMI